MCVFDSLGGAHVCRRACDYVFSPAVYAIPHVCMYKYMCVYVRVCMSTNPALNCLPGRWGDWWFIFCWPLCCCWWCWCWWCWELVFPASDWPLGWPTVFEAQVLLLLLLLPWLQVCIWVQSLSNLSKLSGNKGERYVRLGCTKLSGSALACRLRWASNLLICDWSMGRNRSLTMARRRSCLLGNGFVCFNINIQKSLPIPSY